MSVKVFICGLFIFIFSMDFVFGQEPQGVEEKPRVYIDGHRYPSFDPISNFAWFEIHFPLGETSEILLGGEHFRTYFADRFTIPLEFRQYFSEKSFLLGGYQWEWDLLNEGVGHPNSRPLQEAFFGVGHEVQPSMLLEAKFVQPVGQPSFAKPGFGRGQPRLEFGGRWKF